MSTVGRSNACLHRAVSAWSLGVVALALVWLEAGCSPYDASLIHAVTPDASTDTGRDLPDTRPPPPDAEMEDASDDASDSGDMTGCVPTDDEFCPMACPERCNREDDDCDGRIDEEDPICTLAHASATCFEGVCTIVDCHDDHRDCDNRPDNGCEATRDSTDHCGACNSRCQHNHASSLCIDGACQLGTCDVGYGNCDDDPRNGCERRVDSVEQCGACDHACAAVAHGTPGCVMGQCAVADCDTGYDDCDGQVNNGCETPLDSVTHCGTCDTTCMFDSAGALCSAMTCIPDGCGNGLGDCDTDPANGCEVSFHDDNDNCGACGGECRATLLANTQSATCLDGRCTATVCNAGYGDCDLQANNGCESSLRSLNHCGRCGSRCEFAHAVGSCDDGTCRFVECSEGYGNCDGMTSNGCETPLNTLEDCGACDRTCTVGSGTPSCAGGRCSAAVCNAGFADCDEDGLSCEADLRTSEANCGACGAACGPLAHATADCVASHCTIASCAAGYGDCDQIVQNGCETQLNTTAHCGMCGRTCNYDRAAATCNAGTCAMGACNPGWANCDGMASNGCETQLNTLSHCGGCNDACNLPGAVEACSAGTCVIVTCDNDGLGNCDNNVNNGCEQSLSSLAHCGACGASCALANASESCVARTCQLDACDPGFGNCDNMRSNGCERSLRTTTDCGACGTGCDLARASESCASGMCTLTACDEGFGNCDNNDNNGCEQALNTLDDCGVCDMPCALNNASETCTTGVCQIMACDAGFADCDMTASNGCEQSLRTMNHCGGCNTPCNPANASGSCTSGACTVTSCNTGFADCDGLASNGCERALSGSASCRPRVGRIDSGDDHTCAVKGDGRVVCWGINGSGRLGDDTLLERWAPGIVSTIDDVVAVSAGASHSCALIDDGRVMCWGNNANGRLGDGTITDRRTPVAAMGISDAIDVTTGDGFSCALRRSGDVMCWGYNANGRLGDGTNTERRTPVAVTGISDAIQISASGEHACAVRGNGSVMCWGNNVWGRIGDGTNTERRSPVAVSGINNAVQVSAGEGHSCAVLDTGAVKCWGNNGSGRLGDNTILDRFTPVTVLGLNDATQVSAGLYHTCAVRSGGQVLCWGYNAAGRLGDNTITDRLVPTAVTMISNVVEVSAGGDHTCALHGDGHASCWGNNGSGRLGDGTNTERRSPSRVSGFSNATQLAAGGMHACAVLSDGTLQCWGNGGRLGDGTTILHRGSVEAIGLSNVTQVDAGYEHACALLANHQVWCWGINGSGRLGDNTVTTRTAAVRAGSINDAVQVSTEGASTCAVSEGHLLYCWGNNDGGRLGTGNGISVTIPVIVYGINDAAQVSMGLEHSCYLRTNGSVACAGLGAYGRLGNNNVANQLSFVAVSNLSDAVQIDAGYYHTCAVRSGGGVVCWGRNDLGQLGDNSVTNRNVPVAVSDLSDATKVAGGELFTCALRANGQVMCWGYNALGRLGDGTTTNRRVPVNVVGVSDAVDIAAGMHHACALRASGETVCWGYNGSGQLGDGTLTDRPTAVPIVALP